MIMEHEELERIAIEFSIFRDEFKRGESWLTRQEEKRSGGMITWKGVDDHHIWLQYKASRGREIRLGSQKQLAEYVKPVIIRRVDYLKDEMWIEYFFDGNFYCKKIKL